MGTETIDDLFLATFSTGFFVVVLLTGVFDTALLDAVVEDDDDDELDEVLLLESLSLSLFNEFSCIFLGFGCRILFSKKKL